ncbi:hypothetical protein KEX41_27015 [Burkholderia thailandensis]|uniref:Uncharacterized protein n=1 Tax=Burkholderia thailandensis (strain ATCC 700388 / DSM 13276 / CCUG 48851 / CIP 106301 / E264) TaxID=271848 RepID=Q2SZW7_BURTA|nr:hypothetical protein BTH_I0978 [Burkholderia thailandensis E264]AVR11812.1 hypothetical protein A8H31_22385 [Burkholderia thailandensis]MBS2131843.1 hypothetical protein [Burkholderia thailandensis]MUV21781.1 hypothetical protein [Burkholderia thailandensis]NBC93139.1 hypothetical protein [Burkholderia thailandensis]
MLDSAAMRRVANGRRAIAARRGERGKRRRVRVALVGLVGLIVFVVFVVLMALAAEVVDVPGGALPGNGKVSEFAAPDALSADRGPADRGERA